MPPTLLASPFAAKAAGKFRPLGKGGVVYAFDPAKQPNDGRALLAEHRYRTSPRTRFRFLIHK